MPPKASSQEDEVPFLLCCLSNLDGKVNWDNVAKFMGRFGSAGSAKQYYNRMKTKYEGKIPGADGVEKMAGKKRGANAVEGGKEKGGRKAKAAKNEGEENGVKTEDGGI